MGRFEVLTLVKLKIADLVGCDTAYMCKWCWIYQTNMLPSSSSVPGEPLQTKATCLCKALGTLCPVTHCCIPEDQNP